MNPTTMEILGTALFACAVIHTFLVKKITDYSHHFPKDSTRASFLHLAGEIEVVFGLWAGLYFLLYGLIEGFASMIEFQNKLHFTEPLFVFCIMGISATRPVLEFAQMSIQAIGRGISRVTGWAAEPVDLFVLLVVGPLAGSLITEPGAMTVSALLLSKMIKRVDRSMLYTLIATLFVNISIGGALTPYAAPPILMVASKWNWGLAEVFDFFGYKATIAVIINALIFVLFYRKKLDAHFHALHEIPKRSFIPHWVSATHLFFLFLLVVCAHYPNMAMGVFLFFLGVTTVTRRYQDPLRLKEGLLVAFFLGGLIVFGPAQSWWLTPILTKLNSFALFVGATALTAITDNAALTYLGAQVEGLSDVSKYYLVAGAITGGGLTIIANAPNAAGYTILQEKFEGGLSPVSLLRAALVPTAIAFFCLGFLPTF